jgi:hypothetical protein
MVPLDNDYDALRRALWQETDLRYKQAIMNYLKKKGRYISGVEAHDIDDFSAGDPVGVRIEEVPEIGVDVDLWEEQARQISAVFKQAPEIEKSRVKLNADRIIRHYMDSDGNKIRSTILRYGVSLEAWTKTESGAPIHDQETITLSGLKQFPSVEEGARRALRRPRYIQPRRQRHPVSRGDRPSSGSRPPAPGDRRKNLHEKSRQAHSSAVSDGGRQPPPQELQRDGPGGPLPVRRRGAEKPEGGAH